MADGDRVPPVYDPDAVANYYGPPPQAIDMGEIDAPPPGPAPGSSAFAPPVVAAGYYGAETPQVISADTPRQTAPTLQATGITPESMLPPTPQQPVDYGEVDSPGFLSAGEPGTGRQPISFQREPSQVKRQTPSGAAYGGDPFSTVNKELLQSFEAEKKAAQQLGGAEADKLAMLSTARADMAREQQEAAAFDRAQASFQREELNSHLREVQSQIDAVREQRIDPQRLMGDGGNRILAVIGGLVGGLYQGTNRLSNNPFLDQMNRAIDRDIDAQEKNIHNKAAAIGESLNLVGHLRTIFKDEEMARLQARTLYFEGAKGMLEAEAARYDSPIIMAKTQAAMQAIDRAQIETKKAFLKEAMARAAAAAAAQRAAQEREWTKYKELRELDIKEAHESTERMKATGEVSGKLNERFVATGQDPQTGEPTGYLAGNATEAGKQEEQRAAREAVRREIQDALSIRSEMGTLGRAGWREAPLGVFTPEWQVKMRAKESALKMAMNKGAGLGAYDAGTERLLNGIVGKLDAVGSASDEQMKEVLARLDREDEVYASRGGQRVMKTIDPATGRERIVPAGGFSAPRNPKAGSPVGREK